ncbi:high-affinity choline transporter 1-like [Babylonia areolata]|uniref:high-affinity choline transporter 1-like n=1 Tax=Babylonia areolata TaxID=304850 RepID=UPI003FCFE599
MAIPAVLFGAVGYTADWNQTSYGHPTLQDDDLGLTLPLVFFHMTPLAVSFIGLGAVSAAVMSSTDSFILSSSTMFACNVFAVIFQAVTKRMSTPGWTPYRDSSSRSARCRCSSRSAPC